ncbi:hypothetical protein ACHAWF_018558, partial [Thalassiosira exigua]
QDQDQRHRRHRHQHHQQQPHHPQHYHHHHQQQQQHEQHQHYYQQELEQQQQQEQQHQLHFHRHQPQDPLRGSPRRTPTRTPAADPPSSHGALFSPYGTPYTPGDPRNEPLQSALRDAEAVLDAEVRDIAALASAGGTTSEAGRRRRGTRRVGPDGTASAAATATPDRSPSSGHRSSTPSPRGRSLFGHWLPPSPTRAAADAVDYGDLGSVVGRGPASEARPPEGYDFDGERGRSDPRPRPTPEALRSEFDAVGNEGYGSMPYRRDATAYSLDAANDDGAAGTGMRSGPDSWVDLGYADRDAVGPDDEYDAAAAIRSSALEGERASNDREYHDASARHCIADAYYSGAAAIGGTLPSRSPHAQSPNPPPQDDRRPRRSMGENALASSPEATPGVKLDATTTASSAASTQFLLGPSPRRLLPKAAEPTVRTDGNMSSAPASSASFRSSDGNGTGGNEDTGDRRAIELSQQHDYDAPSDEGSEEQPETLGRSGKPQSSLRQKDSNQKAPSSGGQHSRTTRREAPLQIAFQIDKESSWDSHSPSSLRSCTPRGSVQASGAEFEHPQTIQEEQGYEDAAALSPKDHVQRGMTPHNSREYKQGVMSENNDEVKRAVIAVTEKRASKASRTNGTGAYEVSPVRSLSSWHTAEDGISRDEFDSAPLEHARDGSNVGAATARVEEPEKVPKTAPGLEYVLTVSKELSAYHCWGIVRAQGNARGFLTRRKYRRCNNAARVIQKFVRECKLSQWEAIYSSGKAPVTFNPLGLEDCTELAALIERYSVMQSQNYLEYHSSILDLLRSMLREIKLCPMAPTALNVRSCISILHQHEQYHRYVNTVALFQNNVRSRRDSKEKEVVFETINRTGPKSNDSDVEVRMEHYSNVHHGFILLQAHVRGAHMRYIIRTKAEVVLQIRRYGQLRLGFISLQSIVRGAQVRKRLRAQSRSLSQMERYARSHAGFVLLQARIRGGLVRCEHRGLQLDHYLLFERYERAGLGLACLQARFRGTRCRERLRLLSKGAIKLQARVRGMLVRSRFGKTKKRRSAAVQIQSYVRGRACRNAYLSLLTGLVEMQAIARGMRDRRLVHDAVASIVMVQCFLRTMIQKRRYTSLRSGIVMLQARSRGFLKRMLVRKMNHAILLLQSFFRRVLARCHLIELSTKAAIIQRAWSSSSRSHLEDESYRAMIKIHSFLCMCFERSRFLRMRKGSLTLQARVRGIQARDHAGKVINAALILQSRARSHLARRRRERFCSRVVAIQAMARCMVQRNAFNHFLLSVVTIQAKARSVIQRNMYLQILSGMILVQARARGVKARAFFRKVHGAAMVLQSALRCHMLRRHYLQLKGELMSKATAATVIQSCVRARSCREELHRTQSHARAIQSLFRSWICRRELHFRKESHQRKLQNEAVMIIQEAARSWIDRRETLKQILRWKIAATIIQNSFRSWMHFKKCKQAMAATTIQASFRSWKCRTEMLIIVALVARIQRFYRSHKRYLSSSNPDLLKMSLTIQSVGRMYITRKKNLIQLKKKKSQQQEYGAATALQSMA